MPRRPSLSTIAGIRYPHLILDFLRPACCSAMGFSTTEAEPGLCKAFEGVGQVDVGPAVRQLGALILQRPLRAVRHGKWADHDFKPVKVAAPRLACPGTAP